MDCEMLPPDAVARVNDRLITRKDFEQVLALEVEEGAEPDESTKRRILDRMIDEELRVQRAIELKLHLSDPRVRMDLASAVAEAATAAAEQETRDEALLRAYFDRNRDYFARRGPLRVRRIWIAIVGGNLGEAYTRARTATRLLREKQPFEVVKDIVGNHDPRPIPDKLISPDKISEYIDRPVLNVALTLQPGEVSNPIRTMDGFHVLQVQERRNRENASFETCRRDVEAEYWAESVREALEANAAGLRKTATIRRAEIVP
jgi:peptidyl-prolyl cis-trans isomerase C